MEVRGALGGEGLVSCIARSLERGNEGLLQWMMLGGNLSTTVYGSMRYEDMFEDMSSEKLSPIE
jgi:hypothetical protein